MGTDINAVVEIELDPKDPSCVRCFAILTNLYRNYRMFGLLAGAHGKEKPIFEPRGFVEHPSSELRELYERYGDGHSNGWLYLEELERVQEAADSKDLHAVIAMMRALEQGDGRPRFVFFFDN